MQSYNDRQKWFFFFGLFFPILSLIESIRVPSRYTIRTAIPLFMGFIGAVFILESGGDVYRDTMDFVHVSKRVISFSDYFHSLSAATQIDYVYPFLKWFLSRFFSNPKFFTCIISLIRGCLLTANISYIISKIDAFKISKLFFVLLIFSTTPAFYTHRWWLALQFLIFILLPIIFEAKYSRIPLLFLTAFFHFSFVYVIPIVILGIFWRKKWLNLLILLYSISFYFDTINWSTGADILAQYLPERLFIRSSDYFSSYKFEQNFLARSFYLFFKIYILFFIIQFIKVLKKCDICPPEWIFRLLSICLTVGIFANFANTSTWGWRYLEMVNFLFSAFFLIVVSNYYFYFKSIKCHLFIIFPLYLIIYQVRGLLDVMGPISFFSGNWLTAWIIDEEHSILTMIKSIFLF